MLKLIHHLIQLKRHINKLSVLKTGKEQLQIYKKI